ncbi:hypothetical protein D1007_26994 [Hordeum vulgare]|nr:hypothetical protein D1007_26994 [Hordeum vulgare]
MGAPAAASGLPSDDTHELGGDAVEDDEEDSRRGDVLMAPFAPPPPGGAVVVDVDDCPPPPRALDRLSLRLSSFDTLPPFLLILDHLTTHRSSPLLLHAAARW